MKVRGKSTRQEVSRWGEPGNNLESLSHSCQQRRGNRISKGSEATPTMEFRVAKAKTVGQEVKRGKAGNVICQPIEGHVCPSKAYSFLYRREGQ